MPAGPENRRNRELGVPNGVSGNREFEDPRSALPSLFSSGCLVCEGRGSSVSTGHGPGRDKARLCISQIQTYPTEGKYATNHQLDPLRSQSIEKLPQFADVGYL